jgi:dephospho-CoA kinase
MFIIGITGGIGCGKSTAAQICREAGLPVIDADELSREVTAAGGAAMPAIIEKFGPGVADENGALDRQHMAKKVFQNHRALDQLSSIVHQHVIEQIGLLAKKFEEKKTRALVLDVPIPVKHGFQDLCDQIWVIWASDDIRIARLASRGMESEEARRRMTMQMPRDDYFALADHVIENDGSREDLAEIILKLLDDELGQRGIRIRQQNQE